MAAVVIGSLLAPPSFLPGISSFCHQPATHAPDAGRILVLDCLSARLSLVMARFLWFWAVWVILLWHLSRQDLDLLGLHPDRAGGLG